MSEASSSLELSPVSPLYLPYIYLPMKRACEEGRGELDFSPLHLPTSPLHLPYISPTPPLYLPVGGPRRARLLCRLRVAEEAQALTQALAPRVASKTPGYSTVQYGFRERGDLKKWVCRSWPPHRRGQEWARPVRTAGTHTHATPQDYTTTLSVTTPSNFAVAHTRWQEVIFKINNRLRVIQ